VVAASPGQGAANITRRPRNSVKAEIGLTIFVDVATSKFVAKIASEIDKPDGFRVVPLGSERKFLRPH
jgi:DNA polymerase-4